MALARLGAVVLPIDQRWTPAEKAQSAAAFNAKALIMEEGAEVPGRP